MTGRQNSSKSLPSAVSTYLTASRSCTRTTTRSHLPITSGPLPTTSAQPMVCSAVESWRGVAAPPSADNVVTRSQVLEVDPYGRVLTAFLQNDLYRLDDDFCVQTSYPMPTGNNERVLFAP